MKHKGYLIVIAILVAMIFIIYSYYLSASNHDNSINMAIVMVSIGCSILASAIFAFLYQSNIDYYVQNKLQNEISDNIAKSINLNLIENAKEEAMLSPTRSFPASNSPIQEYNDIVNESLSNTTLYRFKGDRGLYLSYRLKSLGNRSPSLKIELLLLHPNNSDSHKYRAQTLAKCPKYKSMTQEGIVTKLKNELFAVLVAFLDMKNDYDFEISFNDETPFIRYEIMDNYLVLSLLPMQQYGYYPPTLLYSRESIFYPTFLTNFHQIKDKSKNGLVFTSQNISEESILRLSKDSSFPISIAELRKLNEDYFKSLS